MKAVAGAPADERPALGRLANELKQEIEAALDAKRDALASSRPPAGAVDVTLPGRPAVLGRLHPLTQLRTRIEAIFARQGYEIIDGPETEDDWHNFEALNMPPEHPARDMQDTLYLAKPFARPVRGGGPPKRCDAGLQPRKQLHVTSAPPPCSARTRRRCRSATWSRTSRPCASSRRAASTAATTWTSRTRRCSSRSKASWSARA